MDIKVNNCYINKISVFVVLMAFLNIQLTFSQEYKSIRSYKKETGNTILKNGCWLKKDRKQHTVVWNRSNTFNLSLSKGNLKYTTIAQICDFYLWADSEIHKIGHEIKWAGIAAKAANQLSKVDIGFIRIFIVRNKEIVSFVHKGSKDVFSFAFPKLKTVFFSEELIIGEKAISWDQNYGEIEQCEVLNPLYEELSARSLKQLNRMAKGKGIYKLAIPKGLKFEGKLTNCEDRYKHGINKIYKYYQKQSNIRNL